MEITSSEARDALAIIDTMVRKTQHAVSSSGAPAILIIWGSVWLVGYLANHFLQDKTIGYVWLGLDLIGIVLSVWVGLRVRRNIRGSSAGILKTRLVWFWLLLFAYCVANILVNWPVDGKQLAMSIIFFVMLGWLALSLLLSFFPVWWGLAITLLALIGYFLLPEIFYIWMAILGGGGMIALGIYIRMRW